MIKAIAYRAVVVSFLLLVGGLLAQNKFSLKGRTSEIGFLSGFGQGESNTSVPEGIYTPIYFIGHIGMDLLGDVKDENYKRGYLTTYSEPQFNIVHLVNKGVVTKQEFEFGLSTGLKYMHPLFARTYIYISGGTGAHYISTQTVTQHQGFIFNNNFGTGICSFVTKNIAINIGFRLRHMSNLNIWSPNDGINTYNYHFGLSYFINKK